MNHGRAAEVLEALSRHGWSVATAESLTGGLLAAEIVNISGASSHMRGGVVAYATDVKETVLGVDARLLRDSGAVHADVAAQMAAGVCRVLGSDVGIATTGVAGPLEQDDHPVGTVYVAVSTPDGTTVAALALSGDRGEIRAQSVDEALALCLSVLQAP
ncbi:CinA family protein [Microbacterium sp. NPDC076911]|uniref:CinA family protein n=1 Tax=Microbacterium sp. NPDC076911 TaxID=3154958 RepID=UPI0034236E38